MQLSCSFAKRFNVAMFGGKVTPLSFNPWQVADLNEAIEITAVR